MAPGIIIKYKSAHKSQSLQESQTKALDIGKIYGINISFKRMMSGEAEVLSIAEDSAKQLSASELNDIVSKLNQRDDIEFAEVDAWMTPYLTPNDTAYNTQWHYHEAAGGMRLPAAWDITTGSPTVTVAVLDTGYRPHADLVGNVIGQYDMISSPTVSNDGNGRDANAQDPGDWTTEQCGDASDSTWHGTHVAGTVAAVSNNNNFVAGVAWNVGLVPVRVLGTCGGSLSDIADGIRWAAGLNVSGVPTNTNPAQVINLSLGAVSPGACSTIYQNAITAVFNVGTTVVVAAAGNENSSAGYPPANCNNVISVVATNRNGGRAYYSNFGSIIDVAAPGGDACNPTSNSAPDSLADCEGNVWNESNMIQSTYNTGTTTPGADSVGAEQGTSMAAPHVAGLVALMYSIDINATPTEIENVLKSSARPFPNVSSHQCTTAICGEGIVDANAAVTAMGGGSPPPNNVLTNGVAETGLSGSTGNQKAYTMVVPSGANSLAFTLTNMAGDGDLYIKFGSAPTTSNYDCRSWNSTGQDEVCNISTAQAGTYHVLVHAYAAYSGASLLGSYTSASSSQQSLFANTTNVNIPDNNPTGVNSNISVNRTGNSDDVNITYNIVHTYQGDLKVVLTAANGATAVLREPSGGNTSNLNESTTIDAGTATANGTWSLQVIDNAEADTGHIDSWSVEFL